jgi:hypothetical protein
MTNIRSEIASQVPQEGLSPVRLHGGPWDGKDVYVRATHLPFIQVNGPRHGQHAVWITHLYELRGTRWEYVSTDVVPLSAWIIGTGSSGKPDESQPKRLPRLNFWLPVYSFFSSFPFFRKVSIRWRSPSV